MADLENPQMLPADRTLLERIGKRIRALREKAGLSQEAIGERAGFGGKYIGEIEKGVRDVPLSTLRAVAESGLGVTVETLLSEGWEPVSPGVYAQDVEQTAAMFAELPVRVRRALLGLVRALDEPAARAADRPRRPSK